jgi:hypothetical protein
MSIHSKARFHFESFWPRTPGFQEAVSRGWTCPPTIIDPLCRLNAMLHSLKCELQRWAANRIGNVREQLLMARDIIQKLDQASERRELSDREFELWKFLKLKCLGLSSLERTIVWQRSGIRFLTDGDANTKYFHLLSRGRKWRNTIVRIKDSSGNMCTSREEMEATIHGHFQGVFGTPGSGAFTFDHAAVGINAS